LASAAIVELSLRGLGFGHPILYRESASGYEVVPDQLVHRLFKTVKYNANGLRNDAISATPAKGVERILCLGDSITYGGSEVDNSQTYTEQLGRLLPGVEVLNASAAGWSLVNEMKWLADHGLFGSGVLVLQIGENDLFEPFVDPSLLDQHPNFPTRAPMFAITEVMTRYILPKSGLTRRVEDPGVAKSDIDPAAAEAAFEAVEQIHRYAIAHGAPLVILYIDPAEPSVDPRIVAARDRLFAWATQASIRLVRPEFFKHQSRDLRPFRDAFHPNELGNTIIAETLAEALSAHFEDKHLPSTQDGRQLPPA
jgi:lysophospholipase L1-like esterase